MSLTERLFGNFLARRVVTPIRLANFSQNCINRLTANNPGGAWTALLAAAEPAYNAFRAELGDVDQSGAVRKGKTQTLDQLLKDFQRYMKEEQPFLARALGGRDTELYLQLYPRGVMEYTRAAKKSIPTLMARVSEFAEANAAVLGPATTTVLQNFAADWTARRDAQLQAKGEVSENLAQRSAARMALEVVMLAVIHTVAAKYPGNAAQCRQWFDFNLLYPPGYLGAGGKKDEG